MKNKNIISNTDVNEFQIEELTFTFKESSKKLREDCNPDCDPQEHGCDPFGPGCDPGQPDCSPDCYPADDSDLNTEVHPISNNETQKNYSKKPRL